MKTAHALCLAGLLLACTTTPRVVTSVQKPLTPATASVFPKDSAVVGTLSIAKLRRTKLWELLKARYPKQDTPNVEAVCEIDVKTAVTSVSVAMPGDQNPQHVVVVIDAGISEAKAVACAETMAREKGVKVRTEKTDRIVSFIVGEPPGRIAHTSWISDGTVLFTGGDKEFVESILSSQDRLRDNATMMGLTKKVDTEAMFWGVADLTTGPAAAIVAGLSLPERPTAGYVWVTESFSITVGVVFDNATAASSGAETVARAMSKSGTVFSNVDVSTAGTEVILSLDLTGQSLEQLLALVLGPQDSNTSTTRP